MTFHASISLVYLAVGSVALITGAIGVLLPVLPTTPFVLIAAYCISRSSPRLHDRLVQSKLMGPLIREWEAYGVIPLRAKVVATTLIGLLVVYPILFRTIGFWSAVAASGVSASGLVYIWRRPSAPPAGYSGSEEKKAECSS